MGDQSGTNSETRSITSLQVGQSADVTCITPVRNRGTKQAKLWLLGRIEGTIVRYSLPHDDSMKCQKLKNELDFNF